MEAAGLCCVIMTEALEPATESIGTARNVLIRLSGGSWPLLCDHDTSSGAGHWKYWHSEECDDKVEVGSFPTNHGDDVSVSDCWVRYDTER